MPHDRQTALPTGFGFGPPRRAAGPVPLPAARHAAPRGQTLHPIGRVARDFGLTLRALRFYEDKGLISPLRQGTARLYRSEDRERLATILKGKALGFSLREVREMLADPAVAPDRPALAPSPARVRGQIAHLEQQKAEIEAALDRLRRYDS